MIVFHTASDANETFFKTKTFFSKPRPRLYFCSRPRWRLYFSRPKTNTFHAASNVLFVL